MLPTMLLRDPIRAKRDVLLVYTIHCVLSIVYNVPGGIVKWDKKTDKKCDDVVCCRFPFYLEIYKFLHWRQTIKKLFKFC